MEIHHRLTTRKSAPAHRISICQSLRGHIFYNLFRICSYMKPKECAVCWLHFTSCVNLSSLSGVLALDSYCVSHKVEHANQCSTRQYSHGWFWMKVFETQSVLSRVCERFNNAPVEKSYKYSPETGPLACFCSLSLKTFPINLHLQVSFNWTRLNLFFW